MLGPFCQYCLGLSIPLVITLQFSSFLQPLKHSLNYIFKSTLRFASTTDCRADKLHGQPNIARIRLDRNAERRVAAEEWNNESRISIMVSMCAIRRVVYILVCVLVPLPLSELATTSIHASPIHVHTPRALLKAVQSINKTTGLSQPREGLPEGGGWLYDGSSTSGVFLSSVEKVGCSFIIWYPLYSFAFPG